MLWSFLAVPAVSLTRWKRLHHANHLEYNDIVSFYFLLGVLIGCITSALSPIQSPLIWIKGNTNDTKSTNKVKCYTKNVSSELNLFSRKNAYISWTSTDNK